MENKKKITVEQGSYLLIFLIAIIFRVVNLYLAPLSDGEALITLQAENLIRSTEIFNIEPDQILLVNSLGLLFTIFGSQTIFVRLIPALTGALLVFLPFAFRNQIGRNIALVFSLWLSIDPLFYFLSRKVDSTLLSLGFLVLAFLLFRYKKWVGLGVVLALGILSGTQFFIGLILLYLTSVFSKVNLFLLDETEKIEISWKPTLIAFCTALFLMSTVFFIYPSQFGGVLSGLINLFSGFSTDSGLSWINMLTGLLFYELFILVLGFLGLIIFWKQNSKTGRFIGIWIGLAFLLSLVFREQMVSTLIWFILPLAYLAIWLILRVVDIKIQTVKLISLFSVVLFVFLVYIFMLIFNKNTSGFQLVGISINSGVIGIISMMIFILAVVMIGWAWSWKIAQQSLLIAFCVGFVIISLSTAWNLGGGRQPYHNELWYADLLSPDKELILDSITELAKINGLDQTEVKIYLQNIDSASLIWALRHYDVRLLPVLPTALDTEVIITPYESENQVYGPYRGQDYLLKSTPAWNLMTINEWKNWILTRQAPQDGIRQQAIIVWFNNQWFASTSVQN